MKVRLIARTDGVGELAGKSVGEILAYVARVSNLAGATLAGRHQEVECHT